MKITKAIIKYLKLWWFFFGCDSEEELIKYLEQKRKEYEEEAYNCYSEPRAINFMAKSTAYKEVINKIKDILSKDPEWDFLINLLEKKAFNKESAINLIKYSKSVNFIDRLIKEERIEVFPTSPMQVCLTQMGKIIAYGEFILRKQEKNK